MAALLLLALGHAVGGDATGAHRGPRPADGRRLVLRQQHGQGGVRPARQGPRRHAHHRSRPAAGPAGRRAREAEPDPHRAEALAFEVHRPEDRPAPRQGAGGPVHPQRRLHAGGRHDPHRRARLQRRDGRRADERAGRGQEGRVLRAREGHRRPADRGPRGEAGVGREEQAARERHPVVRGLVVLRGGPRRPGQGRRRRRHGPRTRRRWRPIRTTAPPGTPPSGSRRSSPRAPSRPRRASTPRSAISTRRRKTSRSA